MKEVWKDIKGYEGMYQVSNLGNIKSLSRFQRCRLNNIKGFITKEKILKIVPHVRKDINGVYYCDGYKQIGLTTRDKIGKSYSIHQLVAKAFIKNPNHYREVNHINGIKSDNRVENLEWCSRKHNIQHAFDIGLQNNRLKPVLQYDLGMKFIKEFPSINEACRNTQAYSSCISLVCKGIRRTAGGYIWKYK